MWACSAMEVPARPLWQKLSSSTPARSTASAPSMPATRSWITSPRRSRDRARWGSEWRPSITTGPGVNLIDTPGYADFVGEALAALRAVDLAVFVVSAVDGVEVQTEILWEAARLEGIPRVVFVNKLDRDRASFSRTLDELVESFGKRIAPIQIPVGEEQSLSGVVRLVSGRAYRYGSGRTEGTPVDVPPEVADTFEETRSALVESVVETDDDLLEAYFEGGGTVCRADGGGHPRRDAGGGDLPGAGGFGRNPGGNRHPGRVHGGLRTRSS